MSEDTNEKTDEQKQFLEDYSQQAAQKAPPPDTYAVPLERLIELSNAVILHGTGDLNISPDGIVPSAVLVMAQLDAQSTAWRDTAEQTQRNADFYYGLLVKIGEMFGEQAYISDDGSKQQSVLILKVPELVRALIEAYTPASTPTVDATDPERPPQPPPFPALTAPKGDQPQRCHNCGAPLQ